MKKLINLVLALLISCTYVSANTPYSGYVSYVPAGTPVPVTLNQALGSEFSQVGQTFTASLGSPLYAGNAMMAPAGSTVEGTIVSVESAGRTGKPGSMDIRLTTVITPDGRRIPLSASVDQNVFSLSADGGRVSNFAKGAAVGAGAGALSGLVGAAIGGGRLGKTTAIGTGIGAGVGVLGAAFKKGQDLIIQQGTQVPFKLDTAIQASNSAPAPQQITPNTQGYQYVPPTTQQMQQIPVQQTQGGFADPYRQQQPVNPYL
ncbi:MAG: TrbI/VirB10 family protein [Candidatus Caenarcaniphilales bacterium]|nr:TrbI/VirB10 family protein [Candidatus Caenarcaniphilales bacterium]